MAAPDKGGSVEKQFLTPLLRSPWTAALSPAGCRRPHPVEWRQGAALPEPAREQAGLAPHLAGGLDDELELGPLLIVRQLVARGDARKPTLRRQRELLQGHVLGGLVDAPLQLVLLFESAVLGGDQAQHNDLALGHEAQRGEVASTRRIIFEEESIDLDFVKNDLGDWIVAALRQPRRRGIATAHMHAHRHVLGTARN